MEKISLSDFFARFIHEFQSVLKSYPSNPNEYVHLLKVTVNGKIRQIVTYNTTSKGEQLRNLHRLFVMTLNGIYEPHQLSYAYQKGKNIEMCLKKHLSSDTFLKSDIHSYFDTVSYDLLLERILPLHPSLQKRKTLIKKILTACFYEGHLPIGFVSSPILSDIFLNDLDKRMGCIRKIRYTRYADDLILSSSSMDAKERLTDALKTLKEEIAKHNLELNEKKTYIRSLKLEGDAIHLLGLNMVKTQDKKNRITVSQKYIIETSKELGLLLQNKNSIEDWEMRNRFVAVMGKISFIVHASKDSAAKLKKMLYIKTNYNGRLTHKALSEALLKNTRILKEYEQNEQINTYTRIRHFKIFPASGRVWENVSIPTGDSYVRNILCLYLFSICREFEGDASSRISINRMSLSIGGECYHFITPWDTKKFREQIRKIRNESTAVSYSSDYLFDNGMQDELTKYGKYYFTMRNKFRPLIAHPATIGTCVVYSASEKRWLFDQGTREQEPSQKRILKPVAVSEILEYFEWEGRISIDVRAPFLVDKELSQMLSVSLNRAVQLLKPWMRNDIPSTEKSCLSHEFNIRTDAQTLKSIIETLQEVSSLLKQANGVNHIDCWFIPYGFFEAKTEPCLKYICISTFKGQFVMRKFEARL